MRPTLGLIASAFLLSDATCPLAADHQRPIPLAEERRAFADARAASSEDAGRLWGRELDGPILFVDPVSSFLVANRKDAEGRLVEEAGLFTGTLPAEESVANKAFTWAGVRWTMLMWPPPPGKYPRRRLLMHECFHRIQDGLGLPGANPANNHLDGKEGRVWLRLEWRALAEALIRRDAPRRAAIEDALVFRAYRRSLVPRAAAQENALELNEGLAEYTGYRLSGLPESVLADRAAARLEREDEADSLVRSFAYASGPAYGILLDEAGAGWRGGLNAGSDLGALLARAVKLTPPADLASEARRRSASYDGEAVISEETSRAETRRRTLARNQARYVDGPVLVLHFTDNAGYSFDPGAVEAMGDAGTVYLTARVTADWRILEATGGVLLLRDANGRVAEARVPAPVGPSGRRLAGDGWTLSLNDAWEIVAGPRPGDHSVVKRR